MRLLAVVLALCAGLAIIVSGRAQSASAHAMLDHSDPPQDSRLAAAPAKITLYFTQGLKPAGSWILLQDSGGGDVPVNVQFDSANNKVMSATLPSLSPDVYQVKWQSLSADDDDYAGGKFNLTILKPDGSPPAAAGQSSAGSGAPKKSGDSNTTLLAAIAAAGVVVVVGAVVFVISRKPA